MPNQKSRVLFGDARVPNIGEDYILLLGRVLKDTECNLTRFSHQLNATQERQMQPGPGKAISDGFPMSYILKSPSRRVI